MAQPPRPNLDTLSVLDDHGSRRYVYPADARGKWSRLKPWVYLVLIGLYLSLPFLEVAGRPAVLIDIAQRRFFFFGLTFNAQDFWLAFFVLTGIGFALIVVAALWGRVWCGWACPQTVFLDGLFRRVERWIEGPAEARRRLAAAPMNPEKFVRKGLKHLIYLALSFSIAHLFLAYFVGAEKLGDMIADGPADHMSTFLPALVMMAVIYGNFYWFREQLCIVICPYGRLQSVLHDKDTVNINYDHRRGEPRGKAKKVEFPIVDARVGGAEKSQGDCVDCGRCIAVCPTGIDIRNGHQLECIGCAYCIDACDDVMAKLHRPKGLIRYDSLRGIETGERRFWRPRVFFYAFMGAVGLTVASLVMIANDDFEANLLRAKATPFVIEQDVVRNSATLHVINKTADPATFSVNAAAGSEGFIELIEGKVEVEGFGGRDLPLVIRVPRDQYRMDMELFVEVRASYSEQVKRVKVKVLGPRHLVNPGAKP
jgi:cytochrome c oxidase accessory protein FixG